MAFVRWLNSDVSPAMLRPLVRIAHSAFVEVQKDGLGEILRRLA